MIFPGTGEAGPSPNPELELKAPELHPRPLRGPHLIGGHGREGWGSHWGPGPSCCTHPLFHWPASMLGTGELGTAGGRGRRAAGEGGRGQGTSQESTYSPTAVAAVTVTTLGPAPFLWAPDEH